MKDIKTKNAKITKRTRKKCHCMARYRQNNKIHSLFDKVFWRSILPHAYKCDCYKFFRDGAIKVGPMLGGFLFYFTIDSSKFSCCIHTILSRIMHRVEHKVTIIFQNKNRHSAKPRFQVNNIQSGYHNNLFFIIWNFYKNLLYSIQPAISLARFRRITHSYAVWFSKKTCFYETSNIVYLRTKQN